MFNQYLVYAGFKMFDFDVYVLCYQANLSKVRDWFELWSSLSTEK